MPRRPRVEIEGGVYHVYNRVASGEAVFEDPEEALEFVGGMREQKHRDGWTVFAWAVLSNHYHLAIRTSAVPLASGMHALQGKYSRSFNRRSGRSGGLWQSRYHAKLIDEQRYLSQVVLYIHLNPVQAGLATRAVEYAFSGHREIARSVRDPLVDVDDALVCFGETRRAARRAYLAGIRSGADADEGDGVDSGRWWDAIPWRDDALRPSPGAAARGHHDAVRRLPPTADLVGALCRILGTAKERVNGTARDRDTATVRRLIAFLLSQRWGQSRSELAAVLDRNPEVVSHWITEGRRRVAEDAAFGSRLDAVDGELRDLFAGEVEQ